MISNRIYTISEIKKMTAKIAENYDVDKIYLFGSYARNSATSQSDIDFYVENYKYKKFYSLASLYADLGECFNKRIDIITDASIATNKDKRSVNELYNNIIRERISLYESYTTGRGR